MNKLQETYGNIDIYLFDQLLKGRFNDCKKVLDVGCGGGRNIVYFLQNGCEVFGIDTNAEAVKAVKVLSQKLAPFNPVNNFVVSAAEDMPFEENSFDLAIASAVLHFAEDTHQFDRMVRAIFKSLKPGGYFFARLASDIGIEDKVTLLYDRRYILPDGSERFLVNQDMLLAYTDILGGELFEPIKTTNVQNLRCMTTWCVRKK